MQWSSKISLKKITSFKKKKTRKKLSFMEMKVRVTKLRFLYRVSLSLAIFSSIKDLLFKDVTFFLIRKHR